MLFAVQYYNARRAVEQELPDVVEKLQILAACLYTRSDCPVEPGLLVNLGQQITSFPEQKSTLIGLLDIVGNWLVEISGQPSVQRASAVQDITTGVAVAVLSTVVLRALGI